MRIVVLAFAVNFLITTAYAQARFGITAGLNTANQGISNKEVGSVRAYNSAGTDMESLPIRGYNVGLTSLFKITPKIFFRPGMMFITKGQLEQDNATNNQEFSYEDKLHYVEVPFLFSFELGKAKNAGVFFTLGSYYAYGVGGKTTYTKKDVNRVVEADVIFSNTIYSRDNYNPYDLVVKKHDMGVVIGVGGRVKNVFLDINYEMGVLNIQPEILNPRPHSLDNLHNDRKKKNHVLMISLSYYLFKW